MWDGKLKQREHQRVRRWLRCHVRGVGAWATTRRRSLKRVLSLDDAGKKHHALLTIQHSTAAPTAHAQIMPPKHRFHQAGVGSRTGMRPPSSAVNLDDFLDAGKAAMNTPGDGDEDDDDEDEEESDHDDSEVDAYEERSKLSSRKGRPSGKASSSRIDDSNMDVAHSESSASSACMQVSSYSHTRIYSFRHLTTLVHSKCARLGCQLRH